MGINQIQKNKENNGQAHVYPHSQGLPYFRKVKVKCKNCNKTFFVAPSRKRKFCSRDCYHEYSSGKKHYNWKGGEVKRECLFCGKVFFVMKKIIKNGRGIFCKRKCYSKWQSKNRKGKNNFCWRGGVTEEYHKLRTAIKFQNWRKRVFKRDQYTCQMCGDDKGGNLNAHHIKSFKNYPKLRTNIKNGITLCKKCHIKIHSKKKKEVVC